jgi:mono/diheme cytochrome c family protein
MHRALLSRCFSIALIWLVIPSNGSAQQSSDEFGSELLRQHCSSCHAIGISDHSRHPSAPPFRNVVKRYKPEVLAEALAEGIMTGHPEMPIFTFEPQEVASIIQYLEQLSKEAK